MTTDLNASAVPLPGPRSMESAVRQLDSTGVIAVLVIEDASHAVPLAEALLAGGVRAMELALRTPVAMQALSAIVNRVPEILAGVGTILTPDQVREASDAGAGFGVSPGVNPAVVQAAERSGLPFAPGVATPSDIEVSLDLGCRVLKFFPAGALGGMEYLKSIAAPYAHCGVRYIPLGGVTANNLREYLDSPLVAAVGGSWIAPTQMIIAEDWNGITQRAAKAIQLASQRRTPE